MAERFKVTYKIGGEISKTQIEQFAEILNQAGFGVDIDEIRCRSSDSLKAKMLNFGTKGTCHCTFYGDEICWGETDTLDSFCTINNISYFKVIHGNSDYNNCVAWYDSGNFSCGSWPMVNSNIMPVCSVDYLRKELENGRALKDVVDKLYNLFPKLPPLKLKQINNKSAEDEDKRKEMLEKLLADPDKVVVKYKDCCVTECCRKTGLKVWELLGPGLDLVSWDEVINNWHEIKIYRLVEK